ncbi:MAG TPA: hypothetical protein VG939_01555 [Caulobacteraceae bacterium]|nr:hypothetical protein [Caulobacteraceae bacterium]
MPTPFQAAAHKAIVAKAALSARGADSYLRFGDNGAVFWESDPTKATAFESMREAARAALRLPAALRAFGLPLDVELTLAQTAH